MTVYPLVSSPKKKWSTASVDQTTLTVDSGNLGASADLTETIMRDSRVRGALASRVLGLLGLPLIFEADDRTFSAEENKEIGKTFEKMLPICELQKLFSWALCYGIGLAQVIRIPRKKASDSQEYTIRNYPVRFLRWQQEQNSFGRWLLMTQEGEIEIKKDDPNWIMVAPYGSDRPWSQGLWTSLASPWINKQLAYVFRGDSAQNIGTPARVIETSQALTELAQKRLLSEMRSAGGNAVIALPKGAKVSFLEASDGSGNLFSSTIADSNDEMVTAILGQTVTTQGKNMGFGEGTIFENVKRAFINFDAKAYSEALNPFLSRYASENMLASGLSVSWDTTPPEHEEQESKALLSAAQAIAALNEQLEKDGHRVDLVAYAEAKKIKLVTVPKSATQNEETGKQENNEKSSKE